MSVVELLGCAVMDVLTYFGDAFFRVVRCCAMVGAPFPAPAVGAAGVSVASGGGAVSARVARMRLACVVA